MLNRRSCWDALHEIQRVVDISGDIGALPALAISIVLNAWSPPMSHSLLPSSLEQANNSFDVIGAALVEPLDSDAVDLHLGRKPQEVKLFVCPKNRFAVSGPFMPVSGALVIAIAMPPTKANPPTTAMVDRLT